MRECVGEIFASREPLNFEMLTWDQVVVHFVAKLLETISCARILPRQFDVNLPQVDRGN